MNCHRYDSTYCANPLSNPSCFLLHNSIRSGTLESVRQLGAAEVINAETGTELVDSGSPEVLIAEPWLDDGWNTS